MYRPPWPHNSGNHKINITVSVNILHYLQINKKMDKIWALGKGSGLPRNAQPDYQNRSGVGGRYVLPPPCSPSCNTVNEHTTNRTHRSSVRGKNDHCTTLYATVGTTHTTSVTSQNAQLQNCKNFKSCILCTFLTACSVIHWCHHSQWCTHLHTLCNFTSTMLAMKNVINSQLTQIIQTHHSHITVQYRDITIEDSDLLGC
jgi:hypothetical protein